MAHGRGAPDALLDPERPFRAGARDEATGQALGWSEWLERGVAPQAVEAIRQATRTGRPCGSAEFVRRLEGRLARALAPQKRCPKPRDPEEDPQEEFPGLFG
ncbi:MAG: hypothetical protein NTW86_12210 [Candidatus Sumerlaeota bacterium]|nr:hypothetical protein [Candidatus Sumerlaeota bacterium]